MDGEVYRVTWVIMFKNEQLIEGNNLVRANMHLHAKKQVLDILIKQYSITENMIKIISIDKLG